MPDAFILPGLALTAATRSLMVLYGESAATSTPAGSAFTSPIGVYDAPLRSVSPCQCIMPISTVIRPIV